ncbi:MAG TPA: M13 family metallopeptidase [Acidobacteriaceae bacterium]|nr:M13 family metallopeptidase [Acidobacteriaceae bacterium]
MRRLPLFLVVLLVCTAAASAQTAGSAASVKTDKVYAPIPGFDATAMDKTADPCVNFYQYACGNFSKVHPIPADAPEFDEFYNLMEYNTQVLHELLQKAASAQANIGTNEQKVGDYYQSCLDTATIEKRGLAPIEPELRRIAALQSKGDLPQLAARLNRMGVGVFFSYFSMPDFKNATMEIAAIDQGGLGLPEKDYYLRSDAKSEETRRQYVAHVANMLKLLGESPEAAQSDAQKVMDFETALAKGSMGVVERRDPDKIYHMMTLTSFAATAPAIEAPQYLQWMGSPQVEKLNVVSPDFFPALNKTIEATDLPVIQAYLRAHLADAFASRLPHAFDEEHFDFYGRKLEGTPQQQARWKRCVRGTDNALGEALGQLYAAQYFTPDMKAETVQMVQQIEDAMGKDIDELDWMSPETRVKAKQKLHMIANKIGYPNKWRDYSKLEIKPNDALGNEVRAQEFETAYELNKIGKPVDRQEWGMTPPTVNAYYDPTQNNINFPAGILQPAFYDKNATAATNYGHIGAVVGHELTHGFDDEGAKFDGDGNLHDWWTAQDKKNFEERTDCVANEYSQFTAVDDLKVNGKLTLGENTADNGGARLALMALMAHASQSESDPTPEQQEERTFTPQQQFFLGWAQNWCSNERPELVRMLAQTNEHSPDNIRVTGVVVNMPQFAQAFGCKAGQPMAPVKACRVW